MRHDRLTVLNALEAQGVAPVFYNPDPEVCLNVIRACSRGGARAIEFTNRGDFAVDLFGDIARELQRTDPDIILGIGSVVDAGTASLYLNRGARFIVSPCLVPDVAKVCNRRMTAYFP
ncbi:MAG: bifunctional 4-hydroxy-2-oxoglutarate aldolase/2-dehydro-3-deoxy-phosphogluconate aldolase, partial [Brevundimonas sp.]